jgi:hypothetical protein
VLAERHTAVQGRLTAARCQLDTLTQALLEHETLDQQALCTLLGPRPARVASVSGKPQEIAVTG